MNKNKLILKLVHEVYETEELLTDKITAAALKSEEQRLEIIRLESAIRSEERISSERLRDARGLMDDLEKTARELILAYEIDPEMQGKVQARQMEDQNKRAENRSRLNAERLHRVAPRLGVPITNPMEHLNG